MSSNEKIDLALLLDNIRLEISHYYQAGSDVAKVKLKSTEVDYIELIKEHLSIDGRTFTFDEATRVLTIDSSKCQRPD
ncbi:hypothetical protein SAMN04244573_04663 [Azotobacter beijerinckii]|uniref:Uncharacterized protein n=1 Tax=Azotobacter beijerinckii TaxID=170623 RepID=A0A1H9TH93_9GAMM|nr:hypothetical protein [Azotobacter beijerinckii]SEJ58554.1 hypothetical protein SAMN04244579_04862 [Azotobacter beijerinckii]SER96521.1 hypothetical protein SAMN04244573_04663 [Azotobacter beijerinckii]